MTSQSQRIREQLGHPVIDADGHVQEFLPAAMPYLREALGATKFDEYQAQRSQHDNILGGDSWERRQRTRTPQSAWWATPAANTRDLATAAIPALLHERMDEFGIDFSVLFPSKALGIAGHDDDEMRRGLCTGFNTFLHETYAPYADRLTAGAVIPMHTPEEATAELDRCAAMGVKVVSLPEGVLRPITEPGAISPWLMPGQSHWFDTFGLDSAHDYDPVWERCVQHGFAVTFHGGLGDLAPCTFTSISSYVYNHVGFFAERMNRLCKSLFMGGVTHRFPTLNFAFLECGVGWASSLLIDLVEHWEKRNLSALREHLDPALVDYDELERLMYAYGADLLAKAPGVDVAAAVRALPAVGVEPPHLDEFRFTGIETKTDIRDRFVPRFFFGCEADDRAIAFAFSKANAFEARLQPIFSSDLAHWDVEDMNGVVDEAHGLVRNGLLTDADFADFTFHNPLQLFTQGNPGFFDGTAVEGAARAALGEQAATPA